MVYHTHLGVFEAAPQGEFRIASLLGSPREEGDVHQEPARGAPTAREAEATHAMSEPILPTTAETATPSLETWFKKAADGLSTPSYRAFRRASVHPPQQASLEPTLSAPSGSMTSTPDLAAAVCALLESELQEDRFELEPFDFPGTYNRAKSRARSVYVSLS